MKSDGKDVVGSAVNLESVATNPSFQAEEKELVPDQRQGNHPYEGVSDPLVIDRQEIQDDDLEHDPQNSDEDSASSIENSKILRSDTKPEKLPKVVSIEEVVVADFIPY